MLLGPLVEEDYLQDHDADTDEERIRGTQDLVHSESPAIEDEGTDQGRKQIVGQRHPAEEADV